jgi:Zinc finger, C3HC4 type (RING finger)
MNYAFIDARSLIESALGVPMQPAKVPVSVIPCELGPEWKEFEETLGNFKTKYAEARADQGRKSAELSEKMEEISYLEMMLETIRAPGLKGRIEAMIEDYNKEEGIEELKKKAGEAAGKVEAMKAVLSGTNAERYGKFMCFVCMDQLVDLFIEPCGHVICESCWHQTRDHTRCPGCRVRCEGAKKIFSMN